MPADRPPPDAVQPAVAAALHDLAARYAAGADRRDGALFAGAFLPDGRLRVFDPADAAEPRSERVGRPALAEVPTLLDRYDHTFHLLGQARYDLDPAGDAAVGEVYCLAHHHRAGPPATTTVMHIRYRDRYRPVDGRWGIADRQVLVDWTETWRSGAGA